MKGNMKEIDVGATQVPSFYTLLLIQIFLFYFILLHFIPLYQMGSNELEGELVVSYQKKKIAIQSELNKICF